MMLLNRMMVLNQVLSPPVDCLLVPCQWLLHCVAGKTILRREDQVLLGMSVTVIIVDQI